MASDLGTIQLRSSMSYPVPPDKIPVGQLVSGQRMHGKMERVIGRLANRAPEEEIQPGRPVVFIQPLRGQERCVLNAAGLYPVWQDSLIDLPIYADAAEQDANLLRLAKMHADYWIRVGLQVEEDLELPVGEALAQSVAAAVERGPVHYRDPSAPRDYAAPVDTATDEPCVVLVENPGSTPDILGPFRTRRAAQSRADASIGATVVPLTAPPGPDELYRHAMVRLVHMARRHERRQRGMDPQETADDYTDRRRAMARLVDKITEYLDAFE